VLVRDPRAAAASAVRLETQTLQAGLPSPCSFEEHVTTVLQEEYLPWLRGWLACAAGLRGHLRIHWTFWKDVRTRLPVVVNRICRIIGTEHPSIGPFADAAVPEVKANFVTGDDSSWRGDIGETAQLSMRELLDPEVIDLLRLKI
jgi:hypothetical protein